MAIETPRHAEYGCEEIHPGATHNEWIALEIKTGGTDNSDEAAFIGKITLDNEGTAELADQSKSTEDDPGLCLHEHRKWPGIRCQRKVGHAGVHSVNPEGEQVFQIDPSDAAKILDVLRDNEEYHIKRDEMNAAIHRSTDRVRYSPITSETIAQRERLEALMKEAEIAT
jgi:hypothetical protein